MCDHDIDKFTGKLEMIEILDMPPDRHYFTCFSCATSARQHAQIRLSTRGTAIPLTLSWTMRQWEIHFFNYLCPGHPGYLTLDLPLSPLYLFCESLQIR